MPLWAPLRTQIWADLSQIWADLGRRAEARARKTLMELGSFRKNDKIRRIDWGTMRQSRATRSASSRPPREGRHVQSFAPAKSRKSLQGFQIRQIYCGNRWGFSLGTKLATDALSPAAATEGASDIGRIAHPLRNPARGVRLMLGVYHRDSTRNAIWVASALLLGLLASASSARATPVLQVNGGGILTGVQDVVVAGSTYDVTFESGTCADVFGTCETSSFTFHTSSRAVAASNSLLSALSGSAFDGNPADVCYPTICYIYTPFAAPLFPFNNFEAYVDVSALDIFFETPMFLSGPGVLPVGT